jgi:hypothetical protein
MFANQAQLATPMSPERRLSDRFDGQTAEPWP